MKIIEVRDGIIKLESDDSILSSFVKIDSDEKSYIAQILQIKTVEKTAFAKILFLYDGSLSEYDKTTPSLDSNVTEFTSEILQNALSYTNPVIAGQIQNENIIVDSSAFNKKMLVCSDDKSAKNIIVRNLNHQFCNLGENVIIIDTLGTFSASKYVAGVDFKLPLNTASLQFMYNECLNDATADSKSAIVDIFRELSEYSETVKFVPFDVLKNIVDEMVDKSHIFKLLVLKNKLSKYKKLGYFASDSKDVEKVSAITSKKCAVIDVSKLDSAFQNRYIEYIYENIDSDKTKVVLELSNTISKKTLKSIFENKSGTIFVSHTRFKYLTDIKKFFDNFIVSPSKEASGLFSVYSAFLNSMPQNSYLIVGECTNYIPLISELKQIDETIHPKDEILNELIEEEQTSDSAEISEEYTESVPSELIATINEKSSNTISEIAQNLDAPEDIEMFSDEEEEIQEEPEEILEELEETVENSEDSEISEASLDMTAETEEVLAISNDEPVEPAENTQIVEPEIIQEEEPVEEADFVELSEENLDQDEVLSEEKEESLQDDELTSIELDGIDLDLEEEQPEEVSEVISEEMPADLIEETVQEISEPVQPEISEAIPLNDDLDSDDIIELDPSQAGEDDILIDMSENEISDEEIKKEVDKVYTTRKEEDFSENDLDFIDELNSEEEELIVPVEEDDSLLEEISDNEEGIIEEYHPDEPVVEESEETEILETRNSTTPMVPVYDADIPQEDMVVSDPIQQGDSVTHVKYGSGVVEKLVKYGNKTLFMINFDMGGRKLLDPLLTEIKKA